MHAPATVGAQIARAKRKGDLSVAPRSTPKGSRTGFKSQRKIAKTGRGWRKIRRTPCSRCLQRRSRQISARNQREEPAGGTPKTHRGAAAALSVGPLHSRRYSSGTCVAFHVVDCRCV